MCLAKHSISGPHSSELVQLHGLVTGSISPFLLLPDSTLGTQLLLFLLLRPHVIWSVFFYCFLKDSLPCATYYFIALHLAHTLGFLDRLNFFEAPKKKSRVQGHALYDIGIVRHSQWCPKYMHI